MKKKALNLRVSYRYVFYCLALLVLMLFPHKGFCQEATNGGNTTAQELVEKGFENVRWVENEKERVYTIENAAYKLNGVGIANAVNIIQKMGLPEDKTCKVIVTDLNVPQISLTYTPVKGDSVQKAEMEDWQVSYDVDKKSWNEVKKEKKKNSSLFKVDILLYPQLYFKNLIITQVYQVLLEFSPAIEISLWPGMKLTGQIIFPVYNDGYYGAAERIRPGYITLEQNFRLPYNIRAKATVGIFDYKTYGGEINLFYPFKDQRFSLEGTYGYVGFGYFNGFNFIYNGIHRDYFSVGGNFYWPKYNTEFKLRGEKYLLKEKGVRFEVIRHFRYASIGFYAEKAEYAKTNGGFRVFVALPPYKQKRHKYWPRVSTSLGTGISYNAGNEQYYYQMPYSNANKNIMRQNSFNPYFIKSKLLNF